jgi:2-polyprenyl-3-methyl-5-hydroxy-6-metoxy-1,4-benzoquinol methylase
MDNYYPKDYGPHVQKNNNFYTRLFEELHNSYYGYSKSKWKPFKSLLCQFIYNPIPRKFNGNILDIGCGCGFYLWTLKQYGWNVHGVDISKKATDFAIEKYGLSNIYNGELEQRSYPYLFFDVVTLNHTIEHMPDPVSKVKEIFRITKPGGLVSVTTPNVDSLRADAKLISHS